jgi:hypothetical protein
MGGKKEKHDGQEFLINGNFFFFKVLESFVFSYQLLRAIHL